MARAHRRSVSVFVGMTVFAVFALPQGSTAQIPMDAVVQFGPVHPQPAVPGNHVLVPNEVTILKGGTVTFQVNGGGHGVAIYPVSRQTSRTDITADLCPGGPGGPCTGPTANGAFLITDSKGDVIVNIEAFSGFPIYDYANARVLGAVGGSAIFLNGSTDPSIPPPPAPAPGVRLQHRFDKTGRYLVICMNRFHAINDYMFGFVNSTLSARTDGPPRTRGWSWRRLQGSDFRLETSEGGTLMAALLSPDSYLLPISWLPPPTSSPAAQPSRAPWPPTRCPRSR